MPQWFDSMVTDISWERVQLTLHLRTAPQQTKPDTGAIDAIVDTTEPNPGDPGLRANAPADGPAFFIVDKSRFHPVTFRQIGDDTYELRITITAFDGRKAIRNGSWRILPYLGGQWQMPATFDLVKTELLDDASRIFRYSGNKSAMTISFGISEDDRRPEFIMRSYQLSAPSGKKKKQRNPIKLIRTRLTSRKTRVAAVRRVYQAARRFGRVHPNRILFASSQRSEIGGNLARVRDRLIERGLDQQLDLHYSFCTPTTSTPLQTLRTLYLMATSRIVLLDDYFSILQSFTLDTETTLVQLWHAGSGFKAVGFSRFGKPGSPALKHTHRQYTYAIAGSTHLSAVYAEVFGIEEEAVIATGLPRIDTFLDDERTGAGTERACTAFPALRDKKVILFAPTFRGRGIADAHYDYGWIDFDALADAAGPEAIVAFRMHHFMDEPIPIPPQYQDRMIDVTHYPDGNTLLHATDILITDYSSIIYEYSLLDRPMLFFAPDKLNYAATRGFHRDYDLTAPGRVCSTFEELTAAIRDEDYQLWKVANFRAENFDYTDTVSTDRVINRLILADDERGAIINGRRQILTDSSDDKGAAA